MSHIHLPTMQELNPVGKGKAERAEAVESRRAEQRAAALQFLAEGDPVQWVSPPYGKTWNREYNPQPYPESVPDLETYNGTGVGFLYGYYGADTPTEDALPFGATDFAWTLAGWQLVRTGAEVRGRKRHG